MGKKDVSSSLNEKQNHSAFRTPAMKALAAQFLALLLVLLIVGLAGAFTRQPITVIVALFLQGLISAAIVRVMGLARWWIFIQFFFPISLFCAYSLHLPSIIFLVAFLFSLGMYWTTFRSQVPFYPSMPATWKAVADLLPKDRPIRFVDIGSGLGGLVIDLAMKRPESVFVGIELAPLAWLASWLLARLRRSQGRFIYGDYTRLDLSQFDVVFAYLSPAAMPALWKKATVEMRPGSLLLSYEFSVPDSPPALTSVVGSGNAILYGWFF